MGASVHVRCEAHDEDGELGGHVEVDLFEPIDGGGNVYLEVQDESGRETLVGCVQLSASESLEIGEALMTAAAYMEALR